MCLRTSTAQRGRERIQGDLPLFLLPLRRFFVALDYNISGVGAAT
jgi:hypothetical protein